VPKLQKAVFEKLGFSINQVYNNYVSHGDFLTFVCRNVTDTDYLVFFDVDCIPINKDWILKLFVDLLMPCTIVGSAQTANHLNNGQNLYVSPFFFAISTAYLKELDYPDLGVTIDMDAGQNLTAQIIKNAGNVKYWWPTHIEEEKWFLHHPVYNRFGLGTTYNDTIYHAFCSRENLSSNFIRKCESILI